MKRIVFLIAFIVALMFSVQVSADSGSIYNNYLKVDVNFDGRFKAQTADGKALIFQPSYNTYTSITTIRIGTTNYIFTGSPTFSNNISTTDMYISAEDINVRQIFTLVYNTYTKKNDTIEIKYVVTNQGQTSKNIGTRIMIDTMIEGNDKAPFRVPGVGFVNTSSELTGSNVPSYWQVFNDLNNTGLFAQGTISPNASVVKPDKIQFVHWSSVNTGGVLWDYIPNGSIINGDGGDTAVTLQWNQKTIEPGQSREFVTYYGLGDFLKEMTEPVALSVTGPNDAIAGDSIQITAYLENIVSSGTEVTNTVAKLQLPSGFTTSSPVTVNLGTIGNKQIKMCSWIVNISSAMATGDYSYSVYESCNLGATLKEKTLSKAISITGLTQDIAAVWNKSTTKVTIDENDLIIKPMTSTPTPAPSAGATPTDYNWEPWQGAFSTPSASAGDKFIFQTTIDVPENALNLILVNEGTGAISIDDEVNVYINGRKAATGVHPGVGTMTIDKKYLMPGSKNDILLVLKNTGGPMSLSKLKVKATLDPTYYKQKLISYNGFKIQYDETNPLNSKIIKYPSNVIFDNLQLTSAKAKYSSEGKLVSANFVAKITGNVYKYNGWHRIKKLLSANTSSTLEINVDESDIYDDSSYATLNGLKFELAKLELFDWANYTLNIDASFASDESITLSPKTMLNILGESHAVNLKLNLKDTQLIVKAAGTFPLNNFLEVSKSYAEYDQISKLLISGGLTYDIFTNQYSDYSFDVSALDDARIKLKIPEFAEISFGSLSITKDEIAATSLQISFEEDCVIEGLRPSNTPPISTSFNKLIINRNATKLADMIKAIELTITVTGTNNIQIYNGLELKPGAVISGGVDANGIFSVNFKGKFVLPDDAHTLVDADFSIATDGTFSAGAQVTIPNGNGIKIGNIQLNPLPEPGATDTNMKIGFKFVNEVWSNYTKESPKKVVFTFQNVGTTINIPGAGDVNFFITEFALNENFLTDPIGGIEAIKGKISGSVSLFSGNMIVTTGTSGKIDLAYDASDLWTVKATDVSVNFPKVGDAPGLTCDVGLTMSSKNGLSSFNVSTGNTMNLLGNLISITGLSGSVTKNAATGVYSMNIVAKTVTCNIDSVIPSLKGSNIQISYLAFDVADMSNPKVKVSCDGATYNGDISIDLGIEFKAKGLTLDFDNNAVTIIKPSLKIPTFGGLKYYKAADLKDEEKNMEIAASSLTIGYTNGSWDFSIGNVSLPGACVYNVFELNAIKVTLVNLSMAYSDKKFSIKIASASATVSSGYSVELKDVYISNDRVSITGAEMTIPELSLGGIGITNLKARFGEEKRDETGRVYSYFGGGACITIPGLGAVEGNLTVQKYSDNFFGIVKEASFELTLNKAIPLGTTGLSLKKIRGSLTSGDLPDNFPGDFSFMFGGSKNLKIVSMGLGLVDGTSGGKVLQAEADVWVELNNWGFAMDASASIFEGFVKAKAGVAYANEIFAARAEVRVLCLEGKVIMYVYKYDGSTSISGEGSVKVRLDRGAILNKKIWRWRLRIPRNDIWFEGLSGKFGRFTNGKVGFQVKVSFPILGGMSAFVGDGGLKFFTNYNIYVPQPNSTGTVQASAGISTNISLGIKTQTSDIAPAVRLPVTSTILAAASVSAAPIIEEFTEANGIKGTRVKFTNADSLERMVLTAATFNNEPSLTIYYVDANGNKTLIPLTDQRFSKEVNETERLDDAGNETGQMGVSTLFAIANPEKGDWIIEARSDEPVAVTFITKMNESSLKINSASYDQGTGKLNVSGQINLYEGTEIVNLILKTGPKDANDKVIPSDRLVATNNTNDKTEGATKFTIGSDGKFTAAIDVSIMRSGSYNLAAEFVRKVTCSTDGNIFSETGSLSLGAPGTDLYDVASRDDYTENGTIKTFNINNTTMKKVTNLSAVVSAYGSSPDYKYNLDVAFTSTTKTADGYMVFADCYVDNVKKGTRKINIGNMTSIRLSQFTEYMSVVSNVGTMKPVKMLVYIVPYRYNDPSKGFVYDFGGTLGFETITNNITLGPESDKVEVWLQRNSNVIVSGLSNGVAGNISLPIEGTAEGKITINAAAAGKVLVSVDSNDQKAYVSFQKDIIDVAAGASEIKFNLTSNIKLKDYTAGQTNNIIIRVSNASNPDDYKTISIPYSFSVLPLKISKVYPQTFSKLTGGKLDVYGEQLLEGNKVYLGSTELALVADESGKARLTATIPQGFTPGEYEVKVGTSLATATTWYDDTIKANGKIKITDPSYSWVKVRDTGKVQKGTSGKFYIKLDSKTAYAGKVSLRVKTKPAGWTVNFNKTIVNMGEVTEVTVTVPDTEVAGPITVAIEGAGMSSSMTGSVYSDLGNLNVTVTDNAVGVGTSSVSTDKANSGDQVTLYGEGFNSTTTVEIVTPLGPKSAAVVSRDGSNKLTFVVPPSTTSGSVRATTGGQSSTPLIPIKIFGAGSMTNFDTDPIKVFLNPGESVAIRIVNNGKNFTATSGKDIIATADIPNSSVNISVPAATVPGEYLVSANISSNVVVSQRIIVYVVNNGITTEDLSRQVTLNGRNVTINVKGKNVTSLQIAKLEINGTALSRVPSVTTDGWSIDVGMVNHNSKIKYQFNYVISGTTFTTPVYEYIVQYKNPTSTSDIFTTSLFVKDDDMVYLRATPTNGFNPATFKVTYSVAGGTGTSVDMTKNTNYWEVPLGKLSDGTNVSYYFTFGTGGESISTPQTGTRYQSTIPKTSTIPVILTRNPATGKLDITVTSFNVEGVSVAPTAAKAILLTDPRQEIPLAKSGTSFTGALGDIDPGTNLKYALQYIVEGLKYTTYLDTPYYEQGYDKTSNGLMAEYFENKYFSESRFKTIDPGINFDFMKTPPAGGLVQDSTYSVRWSGKVLPRYSEDHTFYVTIPNGKASVWVDGKFLMDGTGNFSGVIKLTAGKVTDIIVEYATDGNGGIKLEWQSTSQAREVVPRARLIASPSSKPVSTEFIPYVTRVDFESASIAWNAPSGITGISSYDLYLGTTLINNTNSRSFTLNSLSANTQYSVTIKAKGSSGTVLASSTALTFKTEAMPNDLALNKAITASSSPNSTQNASKANDGNSSTRWTSNSSDPQWIYVDLGRVSQIVKVRLNWAADCHAKAYRIQVSDNGTTWSEVYSTTSGDGGIDDIKLSSVSGRYVRVYGTSRALTSGYSLWDFNVYGYAKSSIKVQFYNQITDQVNNNIAPTFKIMNMGTENVDLNTLKLRYYYTIDNNKPQEFVCDWTPISPNVTSAFVTMPVPLEKADHYLEVGFQTTTPILKPGEYVEVLARFHPKDYYPPYTQTNDYSFDGVSRTYSDFDKITVYQSGNLIQGVEP
ncbi:MAG TPA: discoidin domain-containing protein [Pseudobacteroides sp.]|uniref:galactose-binding domain-containing protein n=1 Tax=Pseudobacteroides sp. TaxID=1968840 RepID=UPI002F93CFFF